MKKNGIVNAVRLCCAFVLVLAIIDCDDGSGNGAKKDNKPKPGDVTVSSPGIALAWIPAGTFTMGSPASEPRRYGDGTDYEETQHQVTLTGGFYMGVYPVTQGQWVTVMGAGSNPREQTAFLYKRYLPFIKI